MHTDRTLKLAILWEGAKAQNLGRLLEFLDTVGVSTSTFRYWRKRYEEGGPDALSEQRGKRATPPQWAQDLQAHVSDLGVQVEELRHEVLTRERGDRHVEAMEEDPRPDLGRS